VTAQAYANLLQKWQVLGAKTTRRHISGALRSLRLPANVRCAFRVAFDKSPVLKDIHVMHFRLAASLLVVSLVVLPAESALAGKAPFYVPTKDEKAGADYGEFPANYKELVTAYMQRVHRIPASARYVFIGEPSKGTNWAKRREEVIWCYNISVQINPDHSWNGYTLWTLFIRDGKIIREYKT